jgi:hypothetical protein
MFKLKLRSMVRYEHPLIHTLLIYHDLFIPRSEAF